MKGNHWILSFFVFLNGVLPATDLGIRGHGFPIQEESFAEFLLKEMNGLSREDYLKRQELAKRKLVYLAKHPQPVSFLREAKEARTFSFDPSYIAPEELKDINGKIICRKGERINPLETRSLSSGLLFLDGENEEHLSWAKKQLGSFKWILTKGAPITLEERERIPVYFDQGGKYSSLFRIQHIPARVTQSESVLLIEEIPIKEGLKEHSKTPLMQEDLSSILFVSNPLIDPDALLLAETEKKCASFPELFSKSPSSNTSASGFFVFISFSVPVESWKDLSAELENTDGIFVLKGIPHGSFKEFASKIAELRKLGINAPIQIDPLAFEKYGIEHVPAFVQTEGQMFNKVVGNIPLSTVLELFKNRRPS
ncbi:MAG: type-F conjugative transfer system pilin assembly protein TrbC [Chlamydiales bacterium]|nr:type-F conjugative transfer system pilin assembly protein TrbC [Chlamydiales bacterium]MBY0529904.1 type-F conjugative transfer system pilin assembly protein TrbC [Rhabdochlamydiaceae bacterium]